MRLSMKHQLWFLSAFLAGCGLVGPSVPGQTLGSPLLQHDTLSVIMAMDAAHERNCRDRKVIDTKVTNIVRVEGGLFMKGSWIESWVVDRCGTIVTYSVWYTPDGKGGTFFNVIPPPESKKASVQSAFWARLNFDGQLAYGQGRYAEAEKLWFEALKEAEGFGPQSPRLATSLYNLGELYRAQRRHGDAEPLLKQALTIREKVLGPQHLDLGQSLNGLAALYYGQEKYAEAEPLLKRSLSIRERALGPEHPEVTTTLENYAALLRKMNREAEAIPLEDRAKTIRAKRMQEGQTK